MESLNDDDLIRRVLMQYLPAGFPESLPISLDVRRRAFESGHKDASLVNLFESNKEKADDIAHAFVNIFIASYLALKLGLYMHRIPIRHTILAHFGIDSLSDDFADIDFCAGSVMISAFEFAKSEDASVQ